MNLQSRIGDSDTRLAGLCYNSTDDKHRTIYGNVRLELGRAFLSALQSLPEDQRILTLELAQRVNEYGRTIDGKIGIFSLFIPSRSYYSKPRERTTPEGEIAWSLPKPVTRSWNGAIRRISFGLRTIDQLRDPEINLEEIETTDCRKISPKIAEIVKAVVALPQ